MWCRSMLEKAIDENLDNMPEINNKQMQYKLQIDQLTVEVNQLIQERKKYPPELSLHKCLKKGDTIN